MKNRRNLTLPRHKRFEFTLPQSARAGFADGDRFADEGWGAFEIDLSFHREGEAGLDDDVSVMRGWAGADSGPIGAEAVGVNQHAAALGAARFGEADEFVNHAADGVAGFYPRTMA